MYQKVSDIPERIKKTDLCISRMPPASEMQYKTPLLEWPGFTPFFPAEALLFFLIVCPLILNQSGGPHCVSADPADDNSLGSSGCMNDLPIPDVHAHMVHISVLGIEDEISRLC